MNKNIILTMMLASSLSGCILTDKNTNNSDIQALSLTSVANEVFYLKTIDLAKPPVIENNVTLVFSGDDILGNVIKGNAGCNNYYTQYNTTRSALITGQIATTTKRCSYDQMQLEGFIFKVFSENPIISLKGNKLYLKGTTNNLMFEKKPKLLTEEEIKIEKEKKEDKRVFDKMK